MSSSSLTFLLMFPTWGRRLYELGLIITSHHDCPVLITRISYCLVIRHMEILYSSIKCLCVFSLFTISSLFLHLHSMNIPLFSSLLCRLNPHLSPTIQLSALISAHAQPYNILTLCMAGEVICDMEAIALQTYDVVLRSPTGTLHTISVTLPRARVRLCTYSSLAAAAMATARTRSHMLPFA